MSLLFNALKKTYIEQGCDLDFIQDHLYLTDLIDDKTSLDHDKIIKIFYLLDTDIFCDGLKWGFDDTEVRDNSCSWLEMNKEVIKKVILGE